MVVIYSIYTCTVHSSTSDVGDGRERGTCSPVIRVGAASEAMGKIAEVSTASEATCTRFMHMGIYIPFDWQ